jgi:predicted N-formylglutamate amidohydrolase
MTRETIGDGVDFREGHTVVLGGKGSGKSNYVQAKLREPRHRDNLLYDTVREHGDVDGINRYLPEYRRGDEATAELDGVVEKLVLDRSRDRRPAAFIIDEATRQLGGAVPPAVGEVMDLSRHYDVGITFVARRPARLNADVVELADRLVVFAVRGKNDKRRLDEEYEGLADAVVALDEYHYAVIDGRGLTTHKPVPEQDTTAEL